MKLFKTFTIVLAVMLIFSGCTAKTNFSKNINMPDLDAPKITPINYNFTDTNSLPVFKDENIEKLKDDLSNVVNLNNKNNAVNELLKKYYFYIKPDSKHYKEFYKLYSNNYEYPNFITTDSVLHTYHLIYDKFLKNTEEKYLTGLCTKLTEKMLKQSIAIYKRIDDKRTKEAALKNIAYFATAANILDIKLPSNTPSDAKKLAENELEKINQAKSIEKSCIFPYKIDYSQFKVRGHYTRGDKLKKYFKVMMWFGNVPLPFEIGGFDSQRADEQIIQSVLMTHTLFSSKDIIKMWDKLYDITTFFVGESDDLTPYEYLDLIKEVYGTKPNLDSLWQEDKLQLMLEKSKKIRQPLIGASMNGKLGSLKIVDGEELVTAPQFRFMGQRYILDSEIFYNLTYVGPEGNRPFPKGLDFPAALGSSRAYEILTEQYKEQDKWSEYLPNMEKAKQKINNIDKNENLYTLWTSTVKNILNENRPYYPISLQTEYWHDKQLNTFLGNWSENRHDTILYAKQSEPECGCAMPQKVVAYVEPDIPFYEKMDYLANWLKNTLLNQKLADENELKAVDDFINLVNFLKDISLKQVNNVAPSENEYQKLKNYYCYLKKIMVELGGGNTKKVYELEHEEMPVIADIHNYQNTCMEVGVGYPCEIYVLVPIEGQWYLTKGGVFSYYEFLQPLSDRLTDELWRQKLKSDNVPKREIWMEKYYTR